MTEQDIKIKILWAIAILTLVVSSIISTHYARKRLKTRRELKKTNTLIESAKITQEGSEAGLKMTILTAAVVMGVAIFLLYNRKRRR